METLDTESRGLDLLYSSFVIESAKHSNFEQILNDKKKMKLAYKVALSNASKHFRMRKEQGLALYNGLPFNHQDAKVEETYERLVFASYLLWPDDIEFENEYLSMINKTYKKVKEERQDTTDIELPFPVFNEKGWEAEEDYFTKFGNDDYLAFVRYDYICRVRLAAIMRQKEQEEAYSAARNIVNNENVFRYLTGNEIIKRTDLDLATSYVLFPSDEDFAKLLPKDAMGKIKFGLTTAFSNLHMPYVSVSMRSDAINNNTKVLPSPGFKELIFAKYPDVCKEEKNDVAIINGEPQIKGIEEFLFDEEAEEPVEQLKSDSKELQALRQKYIELVGTARKDAERYENEIKKLQRSNRELEMKLHDALAKINSYELMLNGASIFDQTEGNFVER